MGLVVLRLPALSEPLKEAEAVAAVQMKPVNVGTPQSASSGVAASRQSVAGTEPVPPTNVEAPETAAEAEAPLAAPEQPAPDQS